MLQMVTRILLIFLSLMVCSCNSVDFKGLFVPTSEGVEKRFEQSMKVNMDLKAGALEAEGSYVFYVATDPHINQTTKNLSIFNDVLKNDPDAIFGAVLGDCIEVKDNLPKYLEALAYYPDKHACNQEIFHVLGNHDIFFNGWEDFRELVGPSVYWFEITFDGGKDLYITLDTATGTLGGKQTEWFKSFLSANRKDYRHCVVLTHTNFYYTDTSQTSSGNMPVEESFALLELLGEHDVSHVLQGHDHYREDLTYNDVRYTVVGTIRDEAESAEYLKVNVREEICLEWCLIPWRIQQKGSQ